MNTLSEIEEYYKAREQQLLKKLHRQEAALAAAEQTLKRLTENQKAPMDETTEQRTAQEQAFKEKLYRDPLTGIYNRRYYDERLRSLTGEYALAMIDLDNFKEINDRFGPPAGDAALFHAAQTMRSMLRSGDELVRYGGDEFFLLFHGLPAHVLARKLEDICRAVAALTIPEYPDLHLSLSIGGAYGSARVSELVGKADLALYRAKRTKNCAVVLSLIHI